jgi:hypothetical protein
MMPTPDYVPVNPNSFTVVDTTQADDNFKRILAKLDDIDRKLSLLVTGGVQLDGELLRIGNTNETTVRAMMAQFDRLIGKR